MYMEAKKPKHFQAFFTDVTTHTLGSQQPNQWILYWVPQPDDWHPVRHWDGGLGWCSLWTFHLPQWQNGKSMTCVVCVFFRTEKRRINQRWLVFPFVAISRCSCRIIFYWIKIQFLTSENWLTIRGDIHHPPLGLRSRIHALLQLLRPDLPWCEHCRVQWEYGTGYEGWRVVLAGFLC